MSLEPENEISKNKSRFTGPDYQKVFEYPSARYRLKDKERILWKAHYPFARYIPVLFAILCIVAVGTMLYGLFDDVDDEPDPILIILMMSPIIAGMLMIPIGIVFLIKRKSVLKERQSILTDEFVSRSSRLDKSDRDVIKAVRDTLGALYSLDPTIIYPEDTPNLLDFLKSRGNLPPYQFELVLGTARRLGMTLSDREVDHVGLTVSEDPVNVEGLIHNMCLQIAEVEDRQQQERLQGNASQVSEHIKDEGYPPVPDKKTWKKKT